MHHEEQATGAKHVNQTYPTEPGFLPAEAKLKSANVHTTAMYWKRLLFCTIW